MGNLNVADNVLDVNYFREMNKVFDLIDLYANKYKKWSEVADKKESIYYPIIKLYATEIKRLGTVDENASEEEQERARLFTKTFFEYLLKRIILVLQRYIHIICMVAL